MDQSDAAQDIIRCRLCEAPDPPLWCDLCNIYLCKTCVGEHILDISKKHDVIPIEHIVFKNIYPKCSKHQQKICELYCENCTNPICVQCISSKEHQGHDFLDLLEFVNRKKKILQKSLLEIESTILPKYKEIASNIPSQKAYLRETSEVLKTAIDEHGEKLHRQVNNIVTKMKSEVDEKEEKQVSFLKEEEIARTISSIEDYICYQKEVLASRDLSHVYKHKFGNEEFRNAPSKHTVTMPLFSANNFNTDQLLAQFGSLNSKAESDVMTMDLEKVPFLQ